VRQKDIAFTLAKNVVNTQFDNLTDEAIQTAKKSIIDTLGVMVGASGTTSSLGGLVDFVKEAGGKPESTIIGFGGKVPAMMGAFVNGAMVHCLDYDDLEYDSTFHPSGAVVPIAFALAEKNYPVNGRELIAAVALGQDIGIRLALAIPTQRKPPWHRTVVLSTFAGAATASKLLKLDVERTVNALGIALCQSAGSMEIRWSIGNDLAALYFAFPSKAGILSALLADKGIVGIKNCFEGRAGLFNLYFEGKYNRSILTAGLGDIFTGSKIALKPWPSCMHTYIAIDVTLTLMKEHEIHSDDIDRIIVHVGDYTMSLFKPLQERRKPSSAMDAKYSIPFCVSIAAVKGNVNIDDFSPSSLADSKVLEMAQKVVPKVDKKLNLNKGLPRGAVEIITKQGGTFYKELDKPYGHPEKPLTWKEIRLKFRDCVNHSIYPLPEKNATKAIELIENLEKVGNVGEIIQLLVHK